MLVDMNTVTQCIVVSSPFSSARFPINSNAADVPGNAGSVEKMAIAADLSRYAAQFSVRA
jgi:hypothetical protein